MNKSEIENGRSSGIWWNTIGLAALVCLFIAGCTSTPKQRHSGSVVMPDGTVRSESKLRVVK